MDIEIYFLRKTEREERNELNIYFFHCQQRNYTLNMKAEI